MIDLKELNKKQLALLIFESIMSLVYPVLGVFMIVTNFFQLNVYINITLGILFTIYGGYRIYRSYKRLF